MTTDKRSWGFLIVGAGFLGEARAAAVKAAPGASLVGISDAEPAKAARVASRLGCESIADAVAAFRRPDVDAVIVATPHAFHYELARGALEAGKHVLCEKPLAIEPEHARRLASLADEKRLRLGTGFNHRFYPPVRDALALVDAGALGRIHSVRVEIGHQASAEFRSSWHADVAISGGGTFMDNGPHACDLVRRVLGEIVAVKGYRGFAPGLPDDCEEEAHALFRDFDQGHAVVRSSWAQPTGYLAIDARGAEGWLRVATAPWSLHGRIRDRGVIRRNYVMDRVAERIHRFRFGCERSLVEEIQAFIAPYRDLTRGGGTGWDGARATEMIDALYRADETGGEIRLDPPPVSLPASARRRVAGERPR